MEKIAWNDLLKFLSTHNIRLPLKRRDQVLQRIIESTGGHYEHTVEELKNLVKLAWDWSEEEEGGEAKEVEEEYDY